MRLLVTSFFIFSILNSPIFAVTDSSKVVNANSDNFKELVQNSKIPVVLDFYADWCGPCQGMLGALQELSEQYSGQINFVKINVDDEQEIAQKFRVSELPVVLFIKDGKIKGIHTDFSDKDTLEAMIKENLI